MRHFPIGLLLLVLVLAPHAQAEERLELKVAEEAALGDNIRASVVDNSGEGEVETDVCAVRPDGWQRCRHIALPVGQNVAHAVFHASRAGEWRIEMGATSQGVVVIREHFPAGRPTLLMTGDSMMLATRHVLARRLSGKVRTVDDIYVGSGISRPFVINWAKLPAKQVRAYRPDATVISLGVSDGRDLGAALLLRG